MRAWLRRIWSRFTSRTSYKPLSTYEWLEQEQEEGDLDDTASWYVETRGMACSSPRKRAVSNLLALVDQSEGLKTQVGERRWRVKKEEKEQREKMSINQYNFVTVLLLGMIDRLE